MSRADSVSECRAAARSVPPAGTERANPGLHESLLEHLPPDLASGAPILDVGCGTGAWLGRLHARGFRNLTGIDYDTAQSTSAPARIERVDLNRDDWSPLTEQYSLITAIEVAEHIENLGNFFDRLQHHLADGGAILLTTPNIASLAARLRFLLLNQLKQFDSLGDPTHITPLVLATLPRLLKRHGLRITAHWGFPADGRTLTSRGWVSALCAALRPVLPETVPGDNLCMTLVRARQ
ncbi:MAG: class I SAM-dependent methyltransferase [Gammaproteobacteria bacterium]|nr:class I SAM-dependent methyltransferase [Gammaproteobacteria bacterium]